MLSHIVQFAHVAPLLAATTHRAHTPITWIIPVLLILVFFYTTRRRNMRGRGQGPRSGPGRPQDRPRSARQAMQSQPGAWESDTDPGDAPSDRSSDT